MERILGKGLTPEEAADAREFLEYKKQEALKPLEGELEKESWQLRWVERINRYLSEEMAALGIERASDLRPEQFHFLTPESYISHFPKARTDAFFHTLDNAAYFITRPERVKLGKQMLHEAVHMVSHRKWHADVVERKVGQYRSGYVAVNPYKSDEHEHLRGFNEAVVDRMTMEILRRHRDELVRDFDIKPEEEAVPVSYYVDYISVVDTIIKGVAAKSGGDEAEIWHRFKRGIFTGEMMHLRDIERVYGKGALKVLGVLGSDMSDFAKTVNKLVLKYFETDDDKERARIAKQIEIRQRKA